MVNLLRTTSWISKGWPDSGQLKFTLRGVSTVFVAFVAFTLKVMCLMKKLIEDVINIGRKLSPQTEKVLAEFVKAPNSWLYGYELLDRTGLRSGSLYTILNRLHDQGVLRSEWRGVDLDGSETRPHRVYTFTEKGRLYALEKFAQIAVHGMTPVRVDDGVSARRGFTTRDVNKGKADNISENEDVVRH